MGFPRIQFPFKSRKSSLEVKTFLQGLSETCTAGSCDEECLLNKLVCPAILHLQSNLQNLAYCFLENIPAIRL
jgi:hypothetical protein